MSQRIDAIAGDPLAVGGHAGCLVNATLPVPSLREIK